MKKNKRTFLIAVLLSGSTIALTGCGGSNQSQANTENSTTTNSSVANAPAPVSDPAFKPKIDESVDSPTKQTVATFLDSIRRGDEATANMMLTPLARAEISQTQYVIARIGSPEGTFKIGRTGFPYPDQNVALVECQWNEPASKTQAEVVMDIVCEVRKEDEGWRISGMAVTVVGENEPLVIDFEDRNQLQRLGQMTNGESPSTTQSGSNQPGQTVSTGIGQNAATQLPSFQTSPGQVSTDGNQFGQFPQNVPQSQPQFQQQLPQQPVDLGNLPPLPSFPNAGGTQTTTPPANNTFR